MNADLERQAALILAMRDAVANIDQAKWQRLHDACVAIPIVAKKIAEAEAQRFHLIRRFAK